MKIIGTFSFWVGISAVAAGALAVVISLFVSENNWWLRNLIVLGACSFFLGAGFLWIAWRVTWGNMKW